MTLFDAGFRELLRGIVAQVRRPRGRPDDGERARRRRLSSSGTFTGHRAYAHGEDLRTLDWNAYARTGELFVKVLEEEQRRALILLFDASASMTAGEPSRFDGARRYAALLGGVALGRLDGLTLVTADATSAWSGVAALDAMLDHLDRLTPGVTTADAPILRWSELGLRGRNVWISDFAAVDEVERGLRLLGRARRETIGLLPGIGEDDLPDVDGHVELRDPETPRATIRVRVDARLRAELERELRALRRRQDAVFRQAGVPLVRARVPAPGDHRVGSWIDGGWPAWI